MNLQEMCLLATKPPETQHLSGVSWNMARDERMETVRLSGKKFRDFGFDIPCRQVYGVQHE